MWKKGIDPDDFCSGRYSQKRTYILSFTGPDARGLLFRYLELCTGSCFPG